MINANFSKEAWNSVQEMLYAETQAAQLEGTCDQKKKREAMGQPRTPAQEQADKQRAQQQRGRNTISSATRSEAARKAAETRRRCKGGAAGPSTPPPPG